MNLLYLALAKPGRVCCHPEKGLAKEEKKEKGGKGEIKGGMKKL
jgi:hypothetical protein